MALVTTDNEKYEVLDTIGKGAFGIIRKVRRKADNQILCRKEINYLKMSAKERDQLQAEFNILSSLKNPHIVQYYHREHIKQTQELYMYMEYCGGGDLGGVIKELKQKGKLAKEDFVWRVLSQLLAALYRCHYGVDAPEPGDSARPGESKLTSARTNPTILHRDLKPENIFLDGDKAVKLGDFGLSKIMQSHDFASTYVGTPFYMSPEICAAERYTLKSDIWAVGCIIYELCTKEPPFNAQTHLQLINKIRKGDIAPLPKEYSKELSGVVKSCLSTNPLYRPDTETLINHPFVWMARKQQECIRLTRSLTAEKDMLVHKVKHLEEQVAVMEADAITMRAELESQIRREWEVKARLEIDRQVELEYQNQLKILQSQFEQEVSKRVKEQLGKHMWTSSNTVPREASSLPGIALQAECSNHHSSVATAEETDWTNTTDLTELSDLSIQSPSTSTSKPIPSKKTKTPFARSKTTYESPVDVHMADPSPMAISSLNLSPRRQTVDTKLLSGKSLFNKIATNKARLAIPDEVGEDKENELDDSDDESIPELPSPTRPRMQNTDPFKMPPPANPLPSKARPGGLQRQHTIASTNKLAAKPNLFPPSSNGSTTANQLRAGFVVARQDHQPSQIPRSATEGDFSRKSSSPTQSSRHRRLSKIPSRGDLAAESAAQLSTANERNGSTSPIRRAATITNLTTAGIKLQSKLASARSGLVDGTQQANVVAGRTRVELAQARAGGRPMSANDGAPKNTCIRVVEKELPPVPVWDPDVLGEDAMPSPFLKRDTRTVRSLR